MSNGLVLAELRAATRPAHDQLEQTLDLAEASVTLAGYRAVLARFHGFWRSWQPLAASLLQNDALTQPRRRLHLLEADLAALGLPAAAIAALPACPPPNLPDANAALGSLYVMEGSTLGGRVIAKNALTRLGLTATNGCAYFTGYGPQTGAMWQAFLTHLNTAPTTAAPAITTGATATFDTLTHWLSPAAGALQ